MRLKDGWSLRDCVCEFNSPCYYTIRYEVKRSIVKLDHGQVLSMISGSKKVRLIDLLIVYTYKVKKEKGGALENTTNKPMNTCGFFISCYTDVDHLISTKVFGYVWLRCNRIIDHI